MLLYRLWVRVYLDLVDKFIFGLYLFPLVSPPCSCLLTVWLNLGPEGWKDQLEWIQRAKADGVKRFIPSEWGMDHRGQEVAYVKPKEEALKAAQAAEFPDGTGTMLFFSDREHPKDVEDSRLTPA